MALSLMKFHSKQMTCRPSKKSPLIDGINSQDLKIISQCVEQGADINATWPLAQYSIFSKAVEKGDFNIINYLVEKKPDLSCSSANKTTPLIVAIRGNCSSRIIQLLIKNGADVNEKDAFGRSPLNEALLLKKARIVEVLLRNGANVNECDGSGRLSLNLAVINNKLKIVKMVFSMGADINKVDKNKNSALTLARRLNDPSILNYLKENARSGNRKTKVSQGNVVANIRKIDLSNHNVEQAEQKTLREGISEDSVEDIRYLLQPKDVNKIDDGGLTPLAIAIQLQKENIVKFLLSLNANSCKLVNGQSMLQFAVKTQNLQIVQLLLQHGADHTIQTALFEAVCLNNLEIINFFISRGVELNVIYRNGYTVLTKAIESQKIDVVQVLVESGANVNMPDGKDRVPLVIALEVGDTDILSYLPNKGAVFAKEEMLQYFEKLIEHHNLIMVKKFVQSLKVNVDVYFDNGYSPLTKATELGNVQMVEYFLSQSNSIVNDVDANGKLPLSVAATHEDLPMVKCLINAGAEVDMANTEIQEFANVCEDFAHYMDIRAGNYLKWT